MKKTGAILFLTVLSINSANAGFLDDLEKGIDNVGEKISDTFNKDKKSSTKPEENTDSSDQKPGSDNLTSPEASSDTPEAVNKPGEQVTDEKSQAEESLPTLSPQKPATSHQAEKNMHYRSRDAWGINGSLAPLSIPFPLGYGISAHYILNPKWMLEAEYFRSNHAIKIFGFEIGAATEQKYTLQARYFLSDRGSFNFLFGGGYRNLEIRLAKDLFDLATNDYSLTVSEMEAYFIKLGLANQWGWGENKTVTVDWVSLEIPFQADIIHSASRFAEDANDQEKIEDAEHVLKWYPSGAIVKMSIGITF